MKYEEKEPSILDLRKHESNIVDNELKLILETLSNVKKKNGKHISRDRFGFIPDTKPNENELIFEGKNGKPIIFNIDKNNKHILIFNDKQAYRGEMEKYLKYIIPYSVNDKNEYKISGKVIEQNKQKEVVSITNYNDGYIDGNRIVYDPKTKTKIANIQYDNGQSKQSSFYSKETTYTFDEDKKNSLNIEQNISDNGIVFSIKGSYQKMYNIDKAQIVKTYHITDNNINGKNGPVNLSLKDDPQKDYLSNKNFKYLSKGGMIFSSTNDPKNKNGFDIAFNVDGMIIGRREFYDNKLIQEKTFDKDGMVLNHKDFIEGKEISYNKDGVKTSKNIVLENEELKNELKIIKNELSIKKEITKSIAKNLGVKEEELNKKIIDETFKNYKNIEKELVKSKEIVNYVAEKLHIDKNKITKENIETELHKLMGIDEPKEDEPKEKKVSKLKRVSNRELPKEIFDRLGINFDKPTKPNNDNDLNNDDDLDGPNNKPKY